MEIPTDEDRAAVNELHAPLEETINGDPGPDESPPPEPPFPDPNALVDELLALSERHTKLVRQLVSQGLLPGTYEDE